MQIAEKQVTIHIKERKFELNTLKAARLIFKNMGIPLPSGTMEEAATVLATNDYMGWRKCTAKEAQICANDGTAAMAVKGNEIYIVKAEPDGKDEVATAHSANNDTVSIPSQLADQEDVQFYSYSAATTITDYIGVLSIFAANDGGDSSWNTLGHGFLAFQNTSGSYTAVGGVVVEPNEQITFGTWGNKEPHIGIWYNLEAHFLHKQNAYENRVSLSIKVTQEDMNTINDLIAEHDTWALTNNCASFAVKIWNSVSSTKLSAGTPNTPTSLMTSIQSKSGYETKRPIQYNTNIGYVEDGIFVGITTYSRNVKVINKANVDVQFIIPINLNPNSCDMEV